MKLKYLMILGAVTAAIAACGNSKLNDKYADSSVVSMEKNALGDTTVYGLACDGSTDSVVVVLKYSGGDPDTFNILNAMRMHQVFGRVKIGDELAIILDADNKKEVDMMVDLDELKGSWCYKVMPHMRDIAGMPKRMQQMMQKHMPDSMMQSLMVPREYGFKLKRDFQSSPIGYVQHNASTDDMSPVEYPTLKWYNEWRIYNGKLILTQNTTKMMVDKKDRKVINDTAEILLLRRDTLALKFNDGKVIGYYNKDKAQLKHGMGIPKK